MSAEADLREAIDGLFAARDAQARNAAMAAAQEALDRLLATARAEGFAAARERAARIAADDATNWHGAGRQLQSEEIADHIRAMQDEQGAHCGSCGHAFHDTNKCRACADAGTQCIRDDS